MTKRRKADRRPQDRPTEAPQEIAAARPKSRASTKTALVLVGVVVLFFAYRFVAPRLHPPDVPVPVNGVIDDPDIVASVDEGVAAVRAAPTDADAWAALAMTYDANELWAQAEACYRQAVALRGDVAAWWYDLATVLERLDRFDDASAALRRAAELDPAYAPLHVAAALWSLTRGRLEEAETAARRAVAASNGGAAALIVLGRVQLERGQDDEAAKTLAGAVATWPRQWGDPAYPRFLLGTALSRLGHAAEAAPMLANGVVRPPQLPEPWRDDVARRRTGLGARAAGAARLVEANRLREAIAVFEDLHRRRPDNAAVALDLGAAYMMASRADDAVAVLRKAVADHPETMEPTARLVGALWVSGRHDEALQTADAAVARAPQSVDVLKVRGDVRLDSGRAEAALADFEAVARLDPANASARTSVGVARLLLGRDGPAEEAFDEALRRNAGDSTAVAGMAILALHRGDVAAADEWLAKIAKLPPQAARLIAEARAARAEAK